MGEKISLLIFPFRFQKKTKSDGQTAPERPKSPGKRALIGGHHCLKMMGNGGQVVDNAGRPTPRTPHSPLTPFHKAKRRDTPASRQEVTTTPLEALRAICGAVH